MAYRDVAGQVLKVFLAENLRYQSQVGMQTDAIAVGCGDPCAFLSAMLQRMETKERGAGNI